MCLREVRARDDDPGGHGRKTTALDAKLGKGQNGVSTHGVTANFMFFLTEGLLGYSR